MSTDPLAFLTAEKSSSSGEQDPLSFLNRSKPSKLEKGARLGSQYALGAADLAAFPLSLQSQVLESPSAQHAEYRKNIFEDIERLAEQKASGQWDEQDERLFRSLQDQIRNPEKAKQFVKTGNISPSGLIRKGIKGGTGYDLEPEDFGEEAAEFLGGLRADKLLTKGIERGAKLATKEGRSALKTAKIEKQWNNLTRAAAGDAEKQTLLNFAQSLDLSPEATNLLFHSKGNAKFLETTAKKSKKFKSVARELKDRLGNNYEELKRLGREGGYLNVQEAEKLTDDLGDILTDIGKTYVEGPDTKVARTAIEDAIQKILNKPGTVEELINSRQGLKEGINWKNIDRGDALLSKADEAFMNAIKRKNPAVYERLSNTDRAYSKYKQFSGVLREKAPVFKYKGIALPVETGEALTYGAAYLFGGLKGVAVKEGLQRLVTQMAINPAFQKPVQKLQNAMISGSKKNQRQAFITIKHILKEQDPELYKELKDLEID